MPRIILPAKRTTETLRQVFDFASYMAAGDTISGVAGSAAIYRAPDGASNVGVAGGTISGTQVIHAISAGTAGATYIVTCLATLSSGSIIPLSGFLSVFDTIS